MRHSKRRPDSTSERLKLGTCLNHIGQAVAIQCSQPPVRQNALFLLLLPVAGWYLLRFVLQKSTGHTLPSPFSHHLWPWILCVIVISFGIVRNLPGFDWLRP